MTTPTPTTAAPDPVRVAEAMYREELAALGYSPHKIEEIFAGEASTSKVHLDLVMWAERGARAMQEAISAQGGGEPTPKQLRDAYAYSDLICPTTHNIEAEILGVWRYLNGQVTRPAPEVKDATGEEWRNDEPPKSGVPFHGMDVYSMRWTPYSKKSEQYKRGLRGRWQRAKEHGGWENCELPSAWRPDSQYFSGGRDVG